MQPIGHRNLRHPAQSFSGPINAKNIGGHITTTRRKILHIQGTIQLRLQQNNELIETESLTRSDVEQRLITVVSRCRKQGGNNISNIQEITHRGSITPDLQGLISQRFAEKHGHHSLGGIQPLAWAKWIGTLNTTPSRPCSWR